MKDALKELQTLWNYGLNYRTYQYIVSQFMLITYLMYRLHTAILNRPLSSAATKEV